MGEPTDESLPRCAECSPRLWGEKKALGLVPVKDARELCGGATIDDNGVLLIVEPETPGV